MRVRDNSGVVEARGDDISIRGFFQSPIVVRVFVVRVSRRSHTRS